MSIEFVQIIDFNQNVVATAEVENEGEYYSGLVNIDPMPQFLRSQFEEFESVVNDGLWSVFDRLNEQIHSNSFTVVFDDRRHFAIKEIQIYPAEGIISFWIE